MHARAERDTSRPSSLETVRSEHQPDVSRLRGIWQVFGLRSGGPWGPFLLASSFPDAHSPPFQGLVDMNQWNL